MKSRLLLSISFIIVVLVISAQTNVQPIVDTSSIIQETNFYQIQNRFNEKWSSYNVSNGYYYENGIKKKAVGWKQFKRWEWYWENRVNPITGQFPDSSISYVLSGNKTNNQSRSTQGAWSNLGPTTTTGGYEGLGRINCVAFHPSLNNTWWVGSPSGGLWVTNDNGSTWTVLTDDNDILGVSDIAIPSDYATSNTIYIGTGDRDKGVLWTLSGGQHNDNNGIGVLKSVDGGTTWAATGLTFYAFEYVTINRLLISPNDNNTLYAATTYGIFKSADAGVNWSQFWGDNIIDMEFKPGDPNTIYASTYNYWGAPQIIRTTDAGVNWSTVKTFAVDDRRAELSVTAVNSNYVYSIVAKNNNSLSGIYQSTDGGGTFSLVYDGTVANQNLLGWKTDGSDAGVGQGSYDLAIEASPSNYNELYIGGVNTHKSTDGGTTWNAVNCWTSSTTYNKNNAPIVHADHHVLKIRSNDGVLFDGNDGGIYQSSDNGTTWTDKTNGIVLSQMYRLGLSASSSSKIITGLQDNGTKLIGNSTWSDVLGGDGMECIIDYADTNVQYASTPNGNIIRTINHWTASTRITQDYTGAPINNLTETGSWVTPYVIDPSNHQVLYLGLANVWKSTNQGNTWASISTMNSTDKLRSLCVAPSNTQVIYTADKTHIWKTINGGSAWTDITGSLPVSSSNITYISVKNDDPNTLWVSMGEYNNHGVYQSVDAGVTWSNISTGLPSLPTMCIVQNKQNSSSIELYVATDIGVFAKVGGANWFEFKTGLPNVVVTELEIFYDNSQPSNSRLCAATYGRGLWKTELFSSPTSEPSTNFSASDTTIELNGTVQFTDLSSNVPTSWLWSFSPNNISYLNGTSATSVNPEVQFNSIGHYTVTLQASNGVGSDTEVKTNYIDVAYCEANGWPGSSSYISGVVLWDINNTGTGSDGYADYSNLSTELLKDGYTYFITVTNGNPTQNDDLGAWVDWNADGDFADAYENMLCNINNYGQGTFSFQVPTGTEYGEKRLRIRIKTGGSNCGTYCGIAYEGEVEDYTIIVVRPTNTWNGSKNSDWDNGQNWTLGTIPDSNYNVLIPSSPDGGIFPVIPVGYTATCNKLTLDTTASVTVNGILNVIDNN